MTIRHLKIFLAVADSGKMSIAAKQLYITQPTVSQAIRELEKHYQTLLFERLSKKLYITENGRLLYLYAKQLMKQYDHLEECMSPKKRREIFRIGATVSVGGSILSPLVKKFRSRFPQLHVYACVGNTREIEQKLLNMELDAAIVEGFIKSPDLLTIPVLDDPLVLTCSKDHPLASKEHLTPGDLEHADFAVRESGSGTRELLDNFLSRHNLHVNIAFEEYTPDAIKNAVRINQCLTLISGRLIEPELSSGEFAAFSGDKKEWNRSFQVVYHKNKSPGAFIPAFTDLARDCDDPALSERFLRGTFLTEPPTLP